MEEEIKILEKLIEKYRNGNVNMLDLDANKLFKRLILEEAQVQLIENLIKAFRELEERNSILNESNNLKINKINELEKKIIYLTSLVCINDSDKNYIPKSKVKEKIEELESYKGLVMFKKYNYEVIINHLQELMEDK